MRRRLTEVVIRKLTTGKAQEDVFHEGTPSAGIRLTREGRKTFFALYRSPTVLDRNGRPKLRRLYFGEHESGKAGEPRYLTLEEFKAAYQVARGEIAKGTDPQESSSAIEKGRESERHVPVSALPSWLHSTFPDGCIEGSLAHLLARYFEAALTGVGIKPLAPRTLKGYVATAKTHLLKEHGRKPALSFTTEIVSDILAGIADSAPQMSRQVKKVFSAGFEYGRHKDKRMRGFQNPTLGIKILVPRSKRKRWLTDEELEILLHGLEVLSDDKARDVYYLMLASGCRPGEAAGVHGEDIILLNGERVWKVLYKTDQEHLIPLIGPIAEIINRRMLQCGGKGPLFWPNDRTRDYPEQLKKANADIRRVTGLKDYRPHDNRRTMRTHIEALGVRREIGEALLNHQKGEIEGTYALYNYWRERKDALDLWHAKLDSIRKGERHQAA
jgi:integrase